MHAVRRALNISRALWGLSLTPVLLSPVHQKTPHQTTPHHTAYYNTRYVIKIHLS